MVQDEVLDTVRGRVERVERVEHRRLRLQLSFFRLRPLRLLTAWLPLLLVALSHMVQLVRRHSRVALVEAEVVVRVRALRARAYLQNRVDQVEVAAVLLLLLQRHSPIQARSPQAAARVVMEW